MADPATGQRGRFVTFEGGEGAGKSTQIRRLAARLEMAGRRVRLTREPGGSEGAEEIRGLLVTGATGRWDAVTELLLLYAARRDHYFRLIEPALADGIWVLCDRFADSTMAYQGFGRGVDRETIRALHRLVLGEVTPDLTLLLDIAPERGLARAMNGEGAVDRGGETRFERMDLSFHEKLRRGFLAIAAEEPDRVAVIDADRDAEAVADDVAETVRRRLGAAV